MKSIGIVYGFREYGEAHLKKVVKDLNLSFTWQELARCAEHYKRVERRDPFVEELRMLDCLQNTMPDDFPPISITELITADSDAAKSFSDMVAKQKQLASDYPLPMSFQDCASCADRYCERTKDSEAPDLFFSEVEQAQNLRFISSPVVLPKKDDVLLMVSGNELQKKLFDLLKNKNFFKKIVSVIQPSKRSFIRDLADISAGMQIDLSKFENENSEAFLEPLCKSYQYCMILRVPNASAQDIKNDLQEVELNAVAFAVLSESSNFSIFALKGVSFSLESEYIHSFDARIKNSVTIRKQLGLSPRNLTTGSLPIDTDNANLCATAFSDDLNDTFRGAVGTVLPSVASLALAGCDLSDLHLNARFEMSEAKDEIGKLLSGILGCYRMQAEFSMDGVPTFQANEEKSSFFAAVSGKGKELPKQFVKNDNSIYLWEIPSDLIPNLDKVHKDLQLISEAVRNGTVVAGRVICREYLSDHLREMSGDGFFCDLLQGKNIFRDPINLGILLESSEELPFEFLGSAQTRFI